MSEDWISSNLQKMLQVTGGNPGAMKAVAMAINHCGTNARKTILLEAIEKTQMPPNEIHDLYVSKKLNAHRFIIEVMKLNEEEEKNET